MIEALVLRILTIGMVFQSQILWSYSFGTDITIWTRGRWWRFTIIISVTDNPGTNLISFHNTDRARRVDETFIEIFIIIIAVKIIKPEICICIATDRNSDGISVFYIKYFIVIDSNACTLGIFFRTTRGLTLALECGVLSIRTIGQGQCFRFVLIVFVTDDAAIIGNDMAVSFLSSVITALFPTIIYSISAITLFPTIIKHYSSIITTLLGH
mmetsp:Transcript_44005/g.49934  ORF Transcript_44005/g.49934 Transcript_44005/m.49934 type:complete len:212 (+) Transcript_44005:910-1545(+)